MPGGNNEVTPLQYELIEAWPEINQLNPEINAIDKLVSWEIHPSIDTVGRTGILSLSSPLKVSSGVFSSIRALKLKGIGLRDQNGNICPPTIEPYYRANPHIGITRTGEFCPVPSAPAPMGGITVTRAIQEYRNSCILTKNGCPSQVPVRLYRYLDTTMVFNPDKSISDFLGVVVSGLPNFIDFRADTALRYEFADAQTRKLLDQLATDLKIINAENVGLAILSKTYNLFGTTLRKFSMSGLYRYSGTPDNLSFSSEINQVFLMDLDSSLELSECSSTEKPLQVMRDVASALFHLAAFILNPKYIESFPVNQVCDEAPFYKFLSAYYHDVSSELIYKISLIYQNHYLHMYSNAFKNRKFSPSPKRDDETFQEYWLRAYKQHWINREETYSLLMAILWVLHDKSELAIYFPHELTQDKLYDNLATYSSTSIMRKIKAQINYVTQISD